MFKQLIFQIIYKLPVETVASVSQQLTQKYYQHLLQKLPPDEFADRNILNGTLDVLYHCGHDDTIGSGVTPEKFN